MRRTTWRPTGSGRLGRPAGPRAHRCRRSPAGRRGGASRPSADRSCPRSTARTQVSLPWSAPLGISESSSKSPRCRNRRPSTVAVDARHVGRGEPRRPRRLATASSTIGPSSPLVSIVDSGTGTTPDRSAPRNQDKKLGSSSMTSTIRSVRRTPSEARGAGRATSRGALVVRRRWSRQIDGDSIAAAHVDVAIDQPGRRVVGHVSSRDPYVLELDRFAVDARRWRRDPSRHPSRFGRLAA